MMALVELFFGDYETESSAVDPFRTGVVKILRHSVTGRRKALAFFPTTIRREIPVERAERLIKEWTTANENPGA